MKILLYEKINGSKGIERGKYIGEILLIEGKSIINCNDIKIKSGLEKMFQEPFVYISGDPTGETLVQIVNEAKPNTWEFFTEVIYKIRDELDIIGVCSKTP